MKPAPAPAPAAIKADLTIEKKVRCPGRRRFTLAKGRGHARTRARVCQGARVQQGASADVCATARRFFPVAPRFRCVRAPAPAPRERGPWLHPCMRRGLPASPRPAPHLVLRPPLRRSAHPVPVLCRMYARRWRWEPRWRRPPLPRPRCACISVYVYTSVCVCARARRVRVHACVQMQSSRLTDNTTLPVPVRTCSSLCLAFSPALSLSLVLSVSLSLSFSLSLFLSFFLSFFLSLFLSCSFSGHARRTELFRHAGCKTCLSGEKEAGWLGRENGREGRGGTGLCEEGTVCLVGVCGMREGGRGGERGWEGGGG